MENPITASKENKIFDVRLKVVDNLLRVFSSKLNNKINNKERVIKRENIKLPEVERFSKTDKGFFNRTDTKFKTDKDFYTTGALSLNFK
jgi:hypothetical protein